MKKKIPEFKNEKEEARFWSKHSPIEFPDEFKEERAPFEFTMKMKSVNKKRTVSR